MASWWSKPVKIGKRKIAPEDWLQDAWITLTDREIAAILTDARGKDVTIYAVRDKRERHGLARTARGIPIVFDDGAQTKYNKPPIIESDNVLVLADVHAPFHNAEWCSEVVYTARNLGVKDCIIAGDLFDFAGLSSFAKHITINGDDVDVSQEIDSAADFVDVLLRNFERIVYTLGNHEKRLSRAVGVKIRTSLIGTLLGTKFEKRLQIHPYYYAIIKASTGKWRITHPKNSSVIPVRVAARLADKYNMHIVAAHGHDWGESTSTAGYYSAACGACCDIDKLDYVQLEDNLRPVMQNGAWMLVNGNPILLHPYYRSPTSIINGRE